MNKLSPNKICVNIFLGLILQGLLFPITFANSEQGRISQIKINDVSLDEQRTFDRKFIELKSLDNGIINKRTLQGRRSNRAYEGAPPRIPHPVEDFYPSLIGKDCQSCHVMSGYVKKFSAYAPMTPHPDWGSCKQCHVPITTNEVFKNNSFKGYFNVDVGQVGSTAFLPGGPPPIPHSIENRGKCLACHTGLAAIKRIKTTHPERENCRQCHVPVGDDIWVREVK